MRKYSLKSTSAARIDYGTELSAGLKGFAESAPLAAELDPANARLREAYQARLARVGPVAETRAAVRVAEFLAEREIRSLARVLEAAEGGRRGPAFFAVLPDGVTPAVTPRRAVQARELRLLIERLTTCALPAAARLAAEWLPRLVDAAVRLEATVLAHEAAVSAHDDAFRHELRRRDEHARMVDELLGRVRAVFPQDRAQQDAVFPAVNGGRVAEADEDDPAGRPEPAAPDAPVAWSSLRRSFPSSGRGPWHDRLASASRHGLGAHHGLGLDAASRRGRLGLGRSSRRSSWWGIVP